jgi:hypothetical protein
MKPNVRVTATCDFKEGTAQYPGEPMVSMSHLEGVTYAVPKTVADRWKINLWAVDEGQPTEGIKPVVKGVAVKPSNVSKGAKSGALKTEVK